MAGRIDGLARFLTFISISVTMSRAVPAAAFSGGMGPGVGKSKNERQFEKVDGLFRTLTS